MEYINNSKIDYSKLPLTLPLMHSCDCFDGESIIMDGKLEVSMCKVFKEELLYFFYGKSSYPVSEKETLNRTDELYCPICFIINPEKVEMYKAYPFDTGAFTNSFYKQFFHRHMNINNFEIESNLQKIKAYISLVFSNNEDYINGISHISKHEDRYLNSLFRMFNADGSYEFDERANTIEVISNKSVNLHDAIEYIILPSSFMRIEDISKFIINNNIEYGTYSVRSFTAPSRYNEVVFQMAQKFIKDSKVGK